MPWHCLVACLYASLLTRLPFLMLLPQDASGLPPRLLQQQGRPAALPALVSGVCKCRVLGKRIAARRSRVQAVAQHFDFGCTLPASCLQRRQHIPQHDWVHVVHCMVRTAALFAALCWAVLGLLGQCLAAGASAGAAHSKSAQALCLTALLPAHAFLQSPGLQHPRADGAVGLPASGTCLPTAAALAHST